MIMPFCRCKIIFSSNKLVIRDSEGTKQCFLKLFIQKLKEEIKTKFS